MSKHKYLNQKSANSCNIWWLRDNKLQSISLQTYLNPCSCCTDIDFTYRYPTRYFNFWIKNYRTWACSRPYEWHKRIMVGDVSSSWIIPMFVWYILIFLHYAFLASKPINCSSYLENSWFCQAAVERAFIKFIEPLVLKSIFKNIHYVM